MSLTTVSGDLSYSGTLDELSCDGVSAKCSVELLSPARQIELDCVSGDLILTLAEDMGFTASIDSLSGNISTEFDTATRGERHIYGDGSCNIEADTVSGDIIIKKRK